MNHAVAPAVPLHHVAVFSGDLLPVRERWQPLLAALPEGGVLVLLPHPDSPLRPTLLLVAALLQAMGHRVTQLEAVRFLAAPPPETQGQLL